ncbi:hypothetical protein CISIN_1g044835mg [Citrus sinensis]|uniref:Uncharacterized protein n=1 Tax=Citrus sinensis TaxID=2711 RepID=A0A067DKN8_CITSI|nr:hypothetical protein CISIN_1g044835mg [Citrus sinensis]
MPSEQKFDQSMIGFKDTLISQVFPLILITNVYPILWDDLPWTLIVVGRGVAINTKIILTELLATSERFVWAILNS